MFSRQHYKAIAEVIDGKTCVQLLSDNPFDYLVKADVVAALANLFQADNPRFDREKFVKSCDHYRRVT